jgi:hypothetical protein
VTVTVAGRTSNSKPFTIGLKYGFVANYDNPAFANGGPMLSVIGFDGNTPGPQSFPCRPGMRSFGR